MKTEKFIKITKREARQRFAENKPLYLCPHKLRPGFPFSPAAYIGGIDYWKSWDTMYNHWSYYNCSYETGYYAHYYITEDEREKR